MSGSTSAPDAPALKKRCLEPGDGKNFPKNGQMIGLHYVGYIAASGAKFDSSYDRDQQFTLQLGVSHVIRGFEEAVRGMSLDERAVFHIPSDLAYGSRGSGSAIPPDTDLVFDLKILSIEDPPAEPPPARFHNSLAGGSLDLLKYFVKLLTQDGDLDLAMFDQLLPVADICATCDLKVGTGKTLLHIVSELADQQPIDLIQIVIRRSAGAGANLDAADGWGETPLTTVLCMLEADESDEDDETSLPDAYLLAALACYLDLDQQRVTDEIASRVQRQMERISDQDSELGALKRTITAMLEKHLPRARLEELRQGSKLVAYLGTFYDTFEGADPKIVSDFLDAGADPAVVDAHSGFNSLHFASLNAYGKYHDVFQVLDMMLRRNPAAATAVSKTKFTPFSLAADYKDTASQFRCTPNACAMLALGELLPQYDVEAGLVCFKASIESRAPAMKHPGNLRFMEGDRVKCWVQAPGANAWEEGVVVLCGYREECWPHEHPGAAYEVKLDIGGNVFVLSDTEKLIMAERGNTSAKKSSGNTSKSKRFIKQSTDGEWELLDTVTGKVRPCSPPDSD